MPRFKPIRSTRSSALKSKSETDKLLYCQPVDAELELQKSTPTATTVGTVNDTVTDESGKSVDLTENELESLELNITTESETVTVSTSTTLLPVCVKMAESHNDSHLSVKAPTFNGNDDAFTFINQFNK
jgi:hypothetical protein